MITKRKRLQKRNVRMRSEFIGPNPFPTWHSGFFKPIRFSHVKPIDPPNPSIYPTHRTHQPIDLPNPSIHPTHRSSSPSTHQPIGQATHRRHPTHRSTTQLIGPPIFSHRPAFHFFTTHVEPRWGMQIDWWLPSIDAQEMFGHSFSGRISWHMPQLQSKSIQLHDQQSKGSAKHFQSIYITLPLTLHSFRSQSDLDLISFQTRTRRSTCWTPSCSDWRGRCNSGNSRSIKRSNIATTSNPPGTWTKMFQQSTIFHCVAFSHYLSFHDLFFVFLLSLSLSLSSLLSLSFSLFTPISKLSNFWPPLSLHCHLWNLTKTSAVVISLSSISLLSGDNTWTTWGAYSETPEHLFGLFQAWINSELCDTNPLNIANRDTVRRGGKQMEPFWLTSGGQWKLVE